MTFHSNLTLLANIGDTDKIEPTAYTYSHIVELVVVAQVDVRKANSIVGFLIGVAFRLCRHSPKISIGSRLWRKSHRSTGAVIP